MTVFGYVKKEPPKVQHVQKMGTRMREFNVSFFVVTYFDPGQCIDQF